GRTRGQRRPRRRPARRSAAHSTRSASSTTSSSARRGSMPAAPRRSSRCSSPSSSPPHERPPPMTTTTERDALAAAIYATSHITGEFVLRSGIVSNEYFDKYRFEADPALLRDIAAALVPVVPAGTDALAGLELGGVPIAAVLSQLTGLPAYYVRKEPKTYGTCQLAEGGEIDGRRLTVVEDVVT